VYYTIQKNWSGITEPFQNIMIWYL